MISPGVLLGKDLGHEMAHQRGFSSESDANVLGTLVAARSSDPLARYSAYSFLQRQLVTALQRVSSSDAQEGRGGESPRGAKGPCGSLRVLAPGAHASRSCRRPASTTRCCVHTGSVKASQAIRGARGYSWLLPGS